MARIADAYGDGSVRLTCEENIIFVNVPNDKVEAMLAEPLFQRLPVSCGAAGVWMLLVLVGCLRGAMRGVVHMPCDVHMASWAQGPTHGMSVHMQRTPVQPARAASASHQQR